MNFIKFWKSFLSPISFSFGGGGGGGTTQSTGTTYNTNIPEYAQPYVETMLGATQKQLFNMDGSEITGFKPYQPYSTNVNDYVAGFSPLQSQAMQATGQLGVPSQYGQASRMTRQAGLGSLGLAGQMAGAGQDYAQQAQDPNSMQGYMSPYMQNVVDYQKQSALRDYGIGRGLRSAQSVGQGAFGGNRQALVESEAQRALGTQIGGIEAQGAQQAFQNAQQAQQYGANLGMQGRQGALQGLGQYGQMAGQLGQLGGQELAARQGIIQSQYGMGQQQQAAEQQKINQAMQDWANTQQYPLMQLGVMSNMLRGLPMQASTTNQYTAAPNALTQGIGAAGAGASLYNALKGRKGGLPKEFESSKTGIKSYYEGDVVESTKSDLYDLPLEELDKRAKTSTSPTIKRLATAIAKEKRMGLAGGGIIAFQNRGLVPGSYEESKKDLPPVKEPDQDVRDLRNALFNPRMPDVPTSLEKGIKAVKEPAPEVAPPVEISPPAVVAAPAPAAVPAAAPAPGQGNINPAPSDKIMPTAGIKIPGIVPNIGGIKLPTRPVEETQEELDKGADARVKAFGIDPKRAEERAGLISERANNKEEARRAQALRFAEFFAAWGSTPGSTISAGLTALKEKVPSLVTDAREEAKIRRNINKDIAALDKLQREEEVGIKKDYFKERSDLAKRAKDTYGMDIQAYSSVFGAVTNASSRVEAARVGAVNKESKQYTTLVGKRTEIERAITARIKELGPMVETYAAMPDSKEPKTQERIVAARNKAIDATKDLTVQRDEIQTVINGINKHAPESGTSNAPVPSVVNTVTINGKTYTKPANMTDDQWTKYKKDQGVT